MKAVILDADTLGADIDLSPLQAVLEQLTVYGYSASDQIGQRLAGHQIVITNKAPLSRAELEGVQAVFVLATGTNNIDMAAARQLGVAVYNVLDYGSSYVAQHTWMLIMALAGRLPRYQKSLLQGAWQTSRHFCLNNHTTLELAGKNLVLQGGGSIGSQVGKIAKVLGMNVYFAARPGNPQDHQQLDQRPTLDCLLADADVLSFHCPLNSQTHQLLNEDRLQRIKPGCLVVNCARGGIIDELAALRALQAGRLGGLAVDVLPNEPPIAGHALLAALSESLNLIVTPHNAWIGPEARQRIVELTVDNLREFIAGHPTGGQGASDEWR